MSKIELLITEKIQKKEIFNSQSKSQLLTPPEKPVKKIGFIISE